MRIQLWVICCLPLKLPTTYVLDFISILGVLQEHADWHRKGSICIWYTQPSKRRMSMACPWKALAYSEDMWLGGLVHGLHTPDNCSIFAELEWWPLWSKGGFLQSFLAANYPLPSVWEKLRMLTSLRVLKSSRCIILFLEGIPWRTWQSKFVCQGADFDCNHVELPFVAASVHLSLL